MIDSLSKYIELFFAEKGPLISQENFEYRYGQHAMAVIVSKMFEQGGIYIIEAGTGIGKTLAYLLPAVFSGEKVVVSTKTKNLQEQIFYKDLEIIKNLTPFNFKATFIKGRNNYICLNKANKVIFQSLIKDKLVENIKNWINFTKTGDIAELNELSSDISLLNLITSNKETCEGSLCKYFKECFIYKLKLKAEKSDIIIVNHHLLFADMMIKNEGFGKVLPEYKFLICDEAHSLEEIATEYFSYSLSKYQLLDFLSDFEQLEGLDDSVDLIKLKNLINDFFILIDKNLEWNKRITLENFLDRNLKNKLNLIYEKFLFLKDIIDDELLLLRLEKINFLFEKIFYENDYSFVKWCEKKIKNIIFIAAPINISEQLSEFFYSLKGVLFTSATLSINNEFKYFKDRVGIDNTGKEKIFLSEYDYKKQSLLFIPKSFPEPFEKDFDNIFIENILQLIDITSGNAFILFTNLQKMEKIFKLVKAKTKFPVFLQGETSNLDILRKFRDTKNSVLFGSFSFWEGVDIQGEKLSLVVIDKLPFSMPSDPLKKAKIEFIKKEGKNPFWEYQLPEAIMLLKQGFGRLIRSKKDKGILALFDIRIFKKSYGKFFIKNLPDIEVINDINILKNKYLSLK